MRAAVLCSFALASTGSYALHVPAQNARSHNPGSTPMSKSSDRSCLKNTNNNQYLANFEVGDASFTLALDTGSSDLWFAPGEPKLSLNITYGTGSVVGDVAQLNQLSFAGFDITNQSYLGDPKQDSFFTRLEANVPSFQGLAGLGFDTISQINRAVLKTRNETWGRSLMSNIFLLDPSTPNHIAFFLNRDGDLSEKHTGIFDIGTYASGYKDVANKPKHEVFSGSDKLVFQWNLLLDKLTIGGKAQPLESGIKKNESEGLTNVPPAGTISALFDTGTSFAILPPAAFKALYESMGGVPINGTLAYAVPCMAEARLEFTFGNQTVPIHPLDLTYVQVLEDKNLTLCVSAYGPGEWVGGDNDVILGDSFLRNIYAVYNYGDFVKTESGFKTDSPFIQFLPLTNPAAASTDFKKSRAKTLASLPPEVNVATINDPNPKPARHSQRSLRSGPSSGLGSLIRLPSLDSTNSAETSSALRSLLGLVEVMLGLISACTGLLVILVVITVASFLRIKKQGVRGPRAPTRFSGKQADEHYGFHYTD